MKRWIQAMGTGMQGTRDLSYEEAVEAAHEMAKRRFHRRSMCSILNGPMYERGS